MSLYFVKGKRENDGKWVRGLPYAVGGIADHIRVADVIGDIIAYTTYKIVPETMCVCLGIRDINGEWIYSGDIVRHYNSSEFTRDYDVGTIFWDDEKCRFCRTSSQSSNCYAVYRDCKYEIVGNKHDNGKDGSNE